MILRLLPRVGRVYQRIINSLASIAGALIVGGMLIICLDILLRVLVARPQVWVLETVEYILVWSTFLGAAWILSKEGHVKVEIVSSRLNPRAQALLGIITSIIGAIICFIVVVYGIHVVWDHFLRGIKVFSLMAPPKAPLLAIIPIGGFFLFLQFLRRSYGYLQRW